jgi:cytochrome P450
VRRVSTPTGHPAWLATSHDDVRMVLADPRFGKAPLTSLVATTRVGRLLPGLLFTTDPPEHTALRAEVAAAMRLCPSRRLRERMVERADVLLAVLAGDVVRDYAEPLAMWSVRTWLGVPAADARRCTRWAEIVLSVNRFPADVVEDAQLEMIDFMDQLVLARRYVPADDLLTALATTAAAPGPLAATVLATGYETMAAGIANATLTMLVVGGGFGSWPTDRAEERRLIDEVLRFNPVGGTLRSRCALVDVVVGATAVRQGELVLAATGPANRDPARFAEPERFCPGRADNRHVSFGEGERFCVGSQLALMELSVALGRMAAWYPRLRLAVDPSELVVLAGAAEPRPTALPVRWD